MTPFRKERLPASEELMKSFLRSISENRKSAREGWLAREALHSIVRLVRAEQLRDIHRSVSKLVPEAFVRKPVKRPKSRRNSRRQPGQTQLAFGRDD